ncbi:MAG TPA: hypothetical protein VEB20_02770 [Azospirillaceae bacterium]|nr:hypothetical protein [Azospirillaceae bacterium]
MLLAAAMGMAVLALVVLRPAAGAVLYLAATPLLVGVARGDLLPGVRPNEFLLLAIAGGLAARTVLLMLAGRQPRAEVCRIDAVLIALATTGSLLPLAFRSARGLPVTTEDLLYALVLWKYYLLYRVVRAGAATPAQARRCLHLSLASGAVVAVVGILQVADLAGVPAFLHEHYDQPFEGHTGIMTDRGTSTVGSSFGFADLMIMNLVVALALLRQGGPRRRLVPLAALMLAGCMAAGAFSGYLGLFVAVLAFGAVTRQPTRHLLLTLPAALALALAFWPVVGRRLAGFESAAGVPQSWSGRWDNLRDFFLPELLSGANWLVGVRPAARLPAPESWRDWIYIESGYVWLLWTGGLPFLVAFLAFLWIAGRRLWEVAQHRPPTAAGAAAAAGFAYLCVIATLMLFDPHLTVRGSADLFFPLLALSLAGTGQERRPVQAGAALPRRPLPLPQAYPQS